ncbi:MAG: putative exported protein [Cenarchaeum symbiont of Oopsacas minuta]|nr:putative exported protein [Cenarchaeum symbiont of Oopsacas minuta]
MNNRYASIVIATVLLTGVFTLPAFGQSVQITIETDMENYNPGDTINTSGTINKLASGGEITMTVRSSNGNLVDVAQISPNDDNTWSHQLKMSPNAKAGVYTISVLYGIAWTNETTFTLGQGTAATDTTTLSQSTIADIAGDTLVFNLDDIDINYNIIGGTIKSIYPNPDSNSLIIEIDATDDGRLTIFLPRSVIDSEGGPLNGDFFVLVDDDEPKNFKELETTDTYRLLDIEFYAGSETIEIFGTRVIPEFGIVAILVLAVSLVSIIAITSRSKILQITS